MPDRRDRDNELDMVRDITVAKEDIQDLEIRVKIMEDRWDKQDSQVLKWLTRAIMILGLGTMTGSSEVIKKKIVAWLPWLG